MAVAYCPDCEGKISISSEAAVGQRITCPHCDTDLEVISVEPLELDWAYDWSWEDEDETASDDEDEEEEEEEEEDDDYDDEDEDDD